MKNTKNGIIINIVLGIMNFLLGIWIYLSGMNGLAIFLILLSLTVSPFGAYRSWKNGQTLLKFYDDELVLIENGERSIMALAQDTGRKHVINVVRDLDDLSKTGKINGAFIDTTVKNFSLPIDSSDLLTIMNINEKIKNSHEWILVLPGDKYEKETPIESSLPPEGSSIVECESCGAKNIVNSGMIGKCEYCGSPIK